MLLFLFSSLFYDRQVDVEGLFLSEAYMRIGSPRPSRYGEHSKIKN